MTRVNSSGVQSEDTGGTVWTLLLTHPTTDPVPDHPYGVVEITPHTSGVSDGTVAVSVTLPFPLRPDRTAGTVSTR